MRKLSLVHGNDLQIYHDGNHSYIDEQGIGRLYIKASSHITFMNSAENKIYANFAENGSVGLRYNNATKLTTTSSGIDVTGTVTADGLTVNSDGTSSFLSIRNGSNSSFTKLYSDLNGVTILDVDANNVGAAPRFQIDVSEVQALRITEGGDISFYDDTGTTQGLFWDASAESLCLGNTSAGASLDIRKDSGFAIRAENNLGQYFRVAAGGNTEIGGNVTLSSTAPLLYLTNTTSGTGKNWRFSSASNGKLFITQEGVVDAVTLDHTTGNATFAGTITSDGLTVDGNGKFSGTTPILRFTETDTTDLNTRLAHGGGFFFISTENDAESSNTPRLGIDHSSGNVGIGTTSPSVRLDTRLGTTTGKVAEFHNSVGYGIGFTVESDGGVNTINSESNQALAFATNGASNERMRINSSGNVGIGTTNPTTPLDLHGMLRVQESGNTAFYSGNYVRVFSDQSYGFRNSGGLTKAQISMNGNSYFNGGNVGIGLTAPGTKLHVLNGTDNNIAAGVSEVRFIGADKPLTGEQANLVIQTNDDMAANKGGSIGFGGRHTTSSTNGANFAHISGRKENSTSANFAGYLSFGTSDSCFWKI